MSDGLLNFAVWSRLFSFVVYSDTSLDLPSSVNPSCGRPMSFSTRNKSHFSCGVLPFIRIVAMNENLIGCPLGNSFLQDIVKYNQWNNQALGHPLLDGIVVVWSVGIGLGEGLPSQEISRPHKFQKLPFPNVGKKPFSES